MSTEYCPCGNVIPYCPKCNGFMPLGETVTRLRTALADEKAAHEATVAGNVAVLARAESLERECRSREEAYYAQKAQLDAMTRERDAYKRAKSENDDLIWWGDERGGTIKRLEVLDEDYGNDEENLCDGVVCRSGWQPSEEGDVFQVVHPKGTPIVEVD